jgi:hypothetical protein
MAIRPDMAGAGAGAEAGAMGDAADSVEAAAAKREAEALAAVAATREAAPMASVATAAIVEAPDQGTRRTGIVSSPER